MKHMYGSPVSDGHQYHHHQSLEWKGGRNIEIIGNIFDGAFTDDIPSSVFVNFNAYSSAKDVKLAHNTFQHGAGGILVATYGANRIQPFPSQRVQISNNLFWDISGNWYRTPWQNGDGWAIYNGASGIEDFIVDHNTVLLSGGNVATFMYWGSMYHSGVNITNNIITVVGAITDGPYYNQYAWGYQGLRVDDVCEPGFKAGGDAFCGLKDLHFAGNILVGNGPGADQAAISSWYPGLTDNCITPSNMDGPCFINYQQNNSFQWQQRDTPFDFHMSSDQCFGCISVGSTDGKKVGADIDELESAQGKVTLVGATPYATSADITFIAPDDFPCSIDYSDQDSSIISSFTRVADVGSSRNRVVTLSNLSHNTRYYYRVNCATQQPKGQFTTSDLVPPNRSASSPTDAGTISAGGKEVASFLFLCLVFCM